MQNEFSAVYEQDGDWIVAFCLEVPEANGQGRTRDEARESLEAAIKMILELRRQESLERHAASGDPEIVRVA